jgi:hypothetical protein
MSDIFLNKDKGVSPGAEISLAKGSTVKLASVKF